MDVQLWTSDVFADVAWILREFEEGVAAANQARNDALEATPPDTGLYYYNRTIYQPWASWNRETERQELSWRLISVQELTIRVEVPRGEWDTVWTRRIECFYRNRGWSADGMDFIRLSDHGRVRGWDNLDVIQETYEHYFIDPVTGQRYQHVSDFFAPVYDPKPAILEELRTAMLQNRIPVTMLNVIYDRLMVNNFYDDSVHGYISFMINREFETPHARGYYPAFFSVPIERFDMTQFIIPKW